jgi:N-acetylglucosamine-6-sulfatase
MESSACRIAAGVAIVLCLVGVAAPAARPNLLVILVDDLRADALGYAGHPFFQSPNIDRLAREGARFDDAFVITSLCSPSRATLLTGLYTHEHGVRSIWHRLDPERPTVPKLLQNAGYATAWIGKWHLGGDDAPPLGFDRWVSFVAQGSYAHPTLNVDGERSEHRGHMTDILTEYALDFLSEAREAPFYLTLSHLAAHTPYLPQLHLKGRFDGQNVGEPRSGDEDRGQKPGFLECRRVDRIEDRTARGYFELLAGVDESVGKVLDLLEAQGVLDDTLVLFTSDNGYLFGEHMLSDKRVAYEESMRVPLLIRYPRWFEAGTRAASTLALNLDIPRSLLEASAVPAPVDMRGISLRAQAAGERRREEFLYVYYREINLKNPRAECTPDIAALRTLEEKLIVYPHTEEPVELYDLRADSGEHVNLASTTQGRERVEKLSRRLHTLAAELSSDIFAEDDD